MRNKCFFFFLTSHRSGMPNRSLAKAMLGDRALGQFFLNQGGREIKLQYNTFTNIMTRMLSHVKNILAIKK